MIQWPWIGFSLMLLIIQSASDRLKPTTTAAEVSVAKI